MSKIEHAINDGLEELNKIRSEIIAAKKEKDIVMSEIFSQRAALFLINEEINAKSLKIETLNTQIQHFENEKSKGRKIFFDLQSKFLLDINYYKNILENFKNKKSEIKDPGNFEEYNKNLKQERSLLLSEIFEKRNELEKINQNINEINLEINTKKTYLQEQFENIENQNNILKKKQKRLKLEEERVKLLKSKK